MSSIQFFDAKTILCLKTNINSMSILFTLKQQLILETMRNCKSVQAICKLVQAICKYLNLMRNFFLWNLCQSTIEATFVNNQKGGLHLQDQNCFRYRIHHKSETKATYRCVKRDSLKCKASAVLLINQNKIETFINEHNHESRYQ